MMEARLEILVVGRGCMHVLDEEGADDNKHNQFD